LDSQPTDQVLAVEVEAVVEEAVVVFQPDATQ
jgi:hypothetical protein